MTGIRIRKAEKSDIPGLCRMGEAFHAHAKLQSRGLNFSAGSLANYCMFFIDNPATEIFVAATDETLVGSIAGIVSPWFLDLTQKILTEQWWWVDKEFRGRGVEKDLLEALVSWGWGNAADKLIMVSLDAAKEQALRRYYGRQGFEYLETHFIRGI